MKQNTFFIIFKELSVAKLVSDLRVTFKKVSKLCESFVADFFSKSDGGKNFSFLSKYAFKKKKQKTPTFLKKLTTALQ